jgi:hypothetical protein
MKNPDWLSHFEIGDKRGRIMNRFIACATIALVAMATAALAATVGEQQPFSDFENVDGWSGIAVFNGYGGIPAGESVNTVNYYTDDDRELDVLDGRYHVVPIIVQDNGSGALTVWDVGSTHTPDQGGDHAVPWGSDPIPRDNCVYHPAVLQWQEATDDSNGGVISFAGGGGQGMFYFNVDTTNFVPDMANRDIGEVAIGLDVSGAGHSSAAGGRAYQFNVVTGAPPPNPPGNVHPVCPPPPPPPPPPPANLVGELPPLHDAENVDGWSGVPVFSGYEIPAGQAVNTVNYYADGAVLSGIEIGAYHVTPLIVQEDSGIFTIWEVGPTHTPDTDGDQSFDWISMEIPNDGNTYHPGALQWQDGVDDSNGGVISYASAGGDGMFYHNEDGNFYTPSVGDELTAGHSSGRGGRAYQYYFELGGAGVRLQAGDADQDLDFDQIDLVKVQIAGKYLSGQSASWGEGDWDGAPGGTPGSPPPGDGRFDQLDIIAALNAAVYLTGPYAAVAKGGTYGDGQTSITYDPTTGAVGVDAPAGTQLTSVNIDSAARIFTGDPAQNLGGSFDNDSDNNIFKATFGSSFGSLSFGNVAQRGLSEDFVANDLTVVGSLAGGGALGNVDLIYIPEPSALALTVLGLLGLIAFARRRPS